METIQQGDRAGRWTATTESATMLTIAANPVLLRANVFLGAVLFATLRGVAVPQEARESRGLQ